MSDIGTGLQDGGERVAELEAALADARQRLLDVDHRIKNDLQLIASMFLLQLRRLPPGTEREVVRGALERINAVMAVHRRFDAAAPKQMTLDGLIRDVAQEALGAAGRDDIRLSLTLEAVSVPSRQAAPIALIVGELIRNALRHPFPDRPGEVDIRLTARDGAVELSVRDNGDGLTDDFEPGCGFGTALVGLLAQQLRGAFEIAPAGPGVRAVVRFPESP